MRRIAGLTAMALLVILALADSPSSQTVRKAPPKSAPGERSLSPRLDANFRAFFDPMVGDWDCHIRDWREPGQPPSWENHQFRRFEPVLSGRFLQESAFMYTAPESEPQHRGIHLISFDAESNTVRGVELWAHAAGVNAESEGRIRDDGKHVAGTLRSRRTGIQSRLEWTWESAHKHVLRLYKPAADGREFLHSEITYTRRGD